MTEHGRECRATAFGGRGAAPSFEADRDLAYHRPVPVADTPPRLRAPERNKRPGVCYALADDGVELPVVDLTHPAFGDVPDEAARERLVAEFLKNMDRQARMPRFLRGGLYRLMSLRSPLMRAIRGAEGGYLSGMATYLAKLGPENLGEAYATRIDRAVSRSLPCLSMRIRLRNVVELTVEGLGPLLQARPRRPLHLVNIAAGPAMDSINTLLVLRSERPSLLADRAVHIHALDIESSGAAFGRRALGALAAEGGPLEGLCADLQHQRYDWTAPGALVGLAGSRDLGGSIVACSSEGGLFDYADDDVVISNLQTLRGLLPADGFAVGTITRDGTCQQAMRASGVPSPTHLRSPQGFNALLSRAGWRLDRVIDNWMSYDVRMRLEGTTR